MNIYAEKQQIEVVRPSQTEAIMAAVRQMSNGEGWRVEDYDGLFVRRRANGDMWCVWLYRLVISPGPRG